MWRRQINFLKYSRFFWGSVSKKKWKAYVISTRNYINSDWELTYRLFTDHKAADHFDLISTVQIKGILCPDWEPHCSFSTVHLLLLFNLKVFHLEAKSLNSNETMQWKRIVFVTSCKVTRTKWHKYLPVFLMVAGKALRIEDHIINKVNIKINFRIFSLSPLSQVHFV